MYNCGGGTMTLLQIDFPSHGPWGEDFTRWPAIWPTT